MFHFEHKREQFREKIQYQEVNTMKALKKVRLAGVTFGKRQENIRKWGKKETGSYTLVREPDNPHDKYAIGVFYRRYQLGYIPKDDPYKPLDRVFLRATHYVSSG
jgi:hypothetical protein